MQKAKAEAELAAMKQKEEEDRKLQEVCDCHVVYKVRTHALKFENSDSFSTAKHRQGADKQASSSKAKSSQAASRAAILETTQNRT